MVHLELIQPAKGIFLALTTLKPKSIMANPDVSPPKSIIIIGPNLSVCYKKASSKKTPNNNNN